MALSLLPEDRKLKLEIAGLGWDDLVLRVSTTREALLAELKPLERVTTRAKAAGRTTPVTFEDRAREAIEAGDPRPLAPLLQAFQAAVNDLWLKAIWEVFEPAWTQGRARKYLVGMSAADREDLFSDMLLEIRSAVASMSHSIQYNHHGYFWAVVAKSLPKYTDFYRAVFNIPRGAKLNDEKIAWMRGRRRHSLDELDEIAPRIPWRG